MTKQLKEIEIPFGAKDSELIQETIRIPDGCYAFIKGNEIVIKKGEKPAWSEEDELMLNDILMCGERHCYLDAGNISWLKSLKDRVQPKVELTQLDQNILEAAIAFVEQNNHFNCWRGVDKHTVLSALHSLSSQNRWKPSDEQMETLENVRKILHTNKGIYSKANHFMFNFEELIRTLKKLREG